MFNLLSLHIISLKYTDVAKTGYALSGAECKMCPLSRPLVYTVVYFVYKLGDSRSEVRRFIDID